MPGEVEALGGRTRSQVLGLLPGPKGDMAGVKPRKAESWGPMGQNYNVSHRQKFTFSSSHI